MGQPQDMDAATKRATDFSDAMLAVPGYADDSMFFTVRYGEKAKHTLRKCDWEDFQKTILQMSEQWVKCGGGGIKPASGPVDERYAKIKELREHALDIIKDFPDLVRDFDRFSACSRAAISAVMRSGS